jgi:hypothetical protein
MAVAQVRILTNIKNLFFAGGDNQWVIGWVFFISLLGFGCV